MAVTAICPRDLYDVSAKVWILSVGLRYPAHAGCERERPDILGRGHPSKLWISVQSGFRKSRRNLVDKYLRLQAHASLKELLTTNQGTPDALLIEHRPAMRDHENGFLSQHAHVPLRAPTIYRPSA
jgi:hypothetical protein